MLYKSNIRWNKKSLSCSKYIYPGTIDSVILSEVVYYPLILKYHLDTEVSLPASIDVPCGFIGVVILPEVDSGLFSSESLL